MARKQPLHPYVFTHLAGHP